MTKEELIVILNRSKDNLHAKLEEATMNPKPSYNIDGQRVDWGDYIDMLIRGIDNLDRRIMTEEGPVEIHSTFYPV